ncbi:unnamed protein product [Caenorhabditis angaria]|uniref:Uncharacterized protein n=1 Tax=Caenorhabditis angaria TaxID=860376 RepID=A0A9P1IAR9_9PELO|nr:unnamed protein product [Caenorhabditis angaria]
MLISFFLFLFYFLRFCSAELLRTAYCVDKCDVFLHLADAKIPICDEESYLKMNHCVTEMSCSWTESDMEKHRHVANSSEEIICCYRVTKKDGVCENQQQNIENTQPSNDCVIAHAPALLSFITVLLVVIAFQTTYIIWICLTQNNFTKKISHFDNPRLLSS